MRNLALTATAVVGLAASVSAGELRLAEAALAGCAGLLGGVVVAALDDLVALYRSPA